MGVKTLDLQPTITTLTRNNVEQEGVVKEVWEDGSHGEPTYSETVVNPTKIQTLKWELVFNPMKISQSAATPNSFLTEEAGPTNFAYSEYNSSPLLNYMYYSYKYITIVLRAGGDINQTRRNMWEANKMKGYAIDVIVYKDYTDKVNLAQTSFEEANHLPGRIRFKMRRGSKKVVRVKPALRKPYYENDYGVTTYSPCWPKTLLTGAALDQTFKGLKIWVKRPRIEEISDDNPNNHTSSYDCPFDIQLSHYHFINGYKPTRLLTVGKELNFNGLTNISDNINTMKDRLFKLQAIKSNAITSGNNTTNPEIFANLENEIYKQEKMLQAMIMRRDMQTVPGQCLYPKVLFGLHSYPGNMHTSTAQDFSKWASHYEHHQANPDEHLTRHDIEKFKYLDDGRVTIVNTFEEFNDHPMKNEFKDAETQPMQKIPLDHSQPGYRHDPKANTWNYEEPVDDIPIASSISHAEKRKASERVQDSLEFLAKKKKYEGLHTPVFTDNSESVIV